MRDPASEDLCISASSFPYRPREGRAEITGHFWGCQQGTVEDGESPLCLLTAGSDGDWGGGVVGGHIAGNNAKGLVSSWPQLWEAFIATKAYDERKCDITTINKKNQSHLS